MTNSVSGLDQNSVINYDEDFMNQRMLDATQDQISPNTRNYARVFESYEQSDVSTVKVKSRV